MPPRKLIQMTPSPETVGEAQVRLALKTTMVVLVKLRPAVAKAAVPILALLTAPLPIELFINRIRTAVDLYL